MLQCVKCGSADIHTAWHKWEWDCSYDFQQRYELVKGEHLHRHCRGCGFEWTNEPLDKIPPQL